MMNETVMNTTALPEVLLKLISTEKVRVKEIDGMIQLMPVKNEAINSQGANKQPRSELRGILKGQVWMADDFDEPLEEMREYMG